MACVLTEVPLRYLASRARSYRVASTVHEPGPGGRRYRASPTAPTASSGGATPRGSTASSAGRVRLHLKPGQKGTKQLLAQYGDRLVCVRYRYDAQQKKRFKTVELLVAEREWDPLRPRFAAEQIVGLRVGFPEVDVREAVKRAGGTWHPERQLWQLRDARVVALGLNRRIVTGQASNRRGVESKERNLPADARTPSRQRCLHPQADAGIQRQMPPLQSNNS